MRAVLGGMRRFWSVTLGGGVRALNLWEARGGYARAGMGIGMPPPCLLSL